MRLIQGILQPAKIGLSHFQWRQVTKTSNGNLQSVSIETSNPVHGSNMHRLVRSFAAPAPSDALETRKPRKRVAKDERKSMVETYVSKYRAMNSGKFPTISETRKDLGGSHYTIRQILQEIQYNFENSSEDAISPEIKTVEEEISTDFVGEVAQTKELSEKDTRDANILDPKEIPHSSNAVESVYDKTEQFSALSDKSKDVGTQSDKPILEPKSILDSDPDPENSVKQETIAEENLQSDRRQLQESTESETSTKDLTPIEPQRNASMWQNIKSFANGFFDIWRKS